MLPQVLSGSLIASLFIGVQSGNAAPAEVVLDLDVDLGVLDLDVDITSANLGVPGTNVTYDYVVVGGGTAGLAIAARLAENYTVAVIEAGSYYESVNNQSTVPEYLTNFLSTSTDSADWAPTDWGFTTTEQTGPGNVSYHYSRAKTLGGCSAFNAMAYHRGSAGSYARWAELVGDDSYTWENFEPYFSKSVNFSIGADRPDNATIPAQATGSFVDGSGPLHVEYPSYATPFGSWAELGMRELGFPEISDFQHGDLNGSQYIPITVNGETGVRETSQTSFLNYAVNAGLPIKVYNGTMAQKINFDSNKTAVSVDVSTSGGATYQISAKKEIILSAGAIQSPQLLMVSGIGPKDTLEEFDIDVLSDLPGVGQNFQDHIFFGVVYPTNTETSQRLLEEDFLEASIEEYRSTHGGILSSNNLDYFGWSKLPNRTTLSNATLTAMATFPADWPEIEFISGSMPNSALGDTYRDYTLLIPALVAPTARGSVTISSANISVQPVIDPNWLGTAIDQEMLVASLRRVRDIAATSAIQGGIIGDEVAPGAAVQSDEDLLAYIKSSFSTVFHAACTCSMGLESDEMAVLDSQARVYGVSGLRVVDASSFPILPPGHPVATIYALAEKIADDIKNGC